MKKHLSILLIALGIVILLCAVIIVSCTSGNEDKKDETTSSTELTTETDTLNESTHLQASEATVKPTQSSKTETTETKSEETGTSPESSALPEETEAEETTSTAVSASLSFVSNNNGTCTLTGIGNITDSYISIPSRSPEGDVVTAIAEKAFYSNGTIKAIEIPSTVMSIGNMAFSNCRSLLYIAVDNENTMFKDIDGVLFSKDMSTLICYPSGSGMSSFDMPASVKTVSDMAFYNCSALKTVTYPGTVEEWSNIAVGEQNYGLISASISCK